MLYLAVFRMEFQKTMSFLKSVPLNFSICKVSTNNKKCLNLRPKLLYLGIFGLEFEKAIAIFEIKTLKFS